QADMGIGLTMNIEKKEKRHRPFRVNKKRTGYHSYTASSSFIALRILSKHSSGVFPKMRLLLTSANGLTLHMPQNDKHSFISTATSGNSDSIIPSISTAVIILPSQTSTTMIPNVSLSFYSLGYSFYSMNPNPNIFRLCQL